VESRKSLARTAGFLYLAMMPFAAFWLSQRFSLAAPGNPARTAAAIAASEGLLRASIVSWLIAQTIFVFLVLSLYRLLAPVSQRHAVLMVVLGLLGVPIAFLNEVNHFGALMLATGRGHLAAFPPEQLHAQMRFFLDLHAHGVYLAQVFWGLWLLPLGYLVFKSQFLPKVIGVLLMIGCFGYLFDAAKGMLLPDVNLVVSQFTFVGELLLPLWLVTKGPSVDLAGAEPAAQNH
jgi:hypothetical protein